MEKRLQNFLNKNKIRVEIVDNLEEHPGYKEGTILEIREIDEDDYMITKEGDYLSEGEIDFADKGSASNYYKIMKEKENENE